MNNKKLALLLASIIGVNSLFLNLGVFASNTAVYAKDEVGVKTIETSTEKGDNDGEAIITFKNLPSDVLKITGEFEHSVYPEREGIDQKVDNVFGHFEEKDNTLTIDGMTQPGIYTGNVEILYNDGRREYYKLSLAKKPSDSINFNTIVSVGNIKVDNFVLNNGTHEIKDFKPKRVTLSLEGGGSVELTEQNNYQASILDLKSDGKLTSKDKLILKVYYGNSGAYELTSQIVLMERNEQITSAFATNDFQNFGDEISDKLKKDYLKDNVKFVRDAIGDGVYSINVDGKPVVTFNQTIAKSKTFGSSQEREVVGGAPMNVRIEGDTKVRVNIETPTLVSTIDTSSNIKDNFVNTMWIFSGKDSAIPDLTGVSGLGGEYKFSVNNESPILYYDASESDHYTSAVVDGSTAYLDIDPALPTTIDSLLNSTTTVDLSKNMQHGYNAVDVVFSVDTERADEFLDKANDKVRAAVTGDVTKKILGVSSIAGDKAIESKEVKTSIVFAADMYDGVGVQASFKQTDHLEGQIKMSGAGTILDYLGGDYKKVKLNIKGATATVNEEESTDDNIVFDIEFNKDFLSAKTAKWNLNINGTKVSGEVDLTESSIEIANLSSDNVANDSEVIIGSTNNSPTEDSLDASESDKDVTSNDSTELGKYLSNVYESMFGREGDEEGYNFHLKNLKNKTVCLRDFLLNMMDEKEFFEANKTVEDKIEALYGAIVNRRYDSEGKQFWIDEYNKLINVYKSEEETLRAIVDRMVHENEVRDLSNKLGVKW